MAEQYFPTELQDDQGNVIYPHTEADVVFTQKGTTVEEELEKKKGIVVAREDIPVEQREGGTMYFMVGKSAEVSGNSNVKVSPTMGLKVI